MKVTMQIDDKTVGDIIKQLVHERLSFIDVSAMVETKISEIIKSKLSDEKIDNFTRDRVSRILTTESIKDFTYGITKEDVLSNLESKILLMIQNSKDFKLLVKNVLKNSL